MPSNLKAAVMYLIPADALTGHRLTWFFFFYAFRVDRSTAPNIDVPVHVMSDKVTGLGFTYCLIAYA